MERDPSFKQVIPYLVLRDGARWFLMRRTDAGGDPRLHGRYSIGVGGHLNPGDGGLLGGLRREWSEEVVADFVPEFRLVALLNDDTTEVGAVHLGAVYVADADGPAGHDPRDRQADRLVRRARRRSLRSPTSSRRGAASASSSWPRPRAQPVAGRAADLRKSHVAVRAMSRIRRMPVKSGPIIARADVDRGWCRRTAPSMEV